MAASRREIVELWQGDQEALQVTKTILATDVLDFVALRAYYICAAGRGERF
jgi:hypothetical protein